MNSIEVKLTPIEYDAGPYPLYGGGYVIPDHIMQKDESLRRNRVYISFRNSAGWAICHSKEVLFKDGTWGYEPFALNRKTQFFEQTRFSTPEEAFVFWCEARKKMIENGKQRDRWECENKEIHV
jgi:hypothetical protein